ncbi:MAG TPA: hypothetical protein VFV78_02515 [Vicinamibacterales bacterium]|nr:hypothetical protein [Vicinamibacterales bacterium]
MFDPREFALSAAQGCALLHAQPIHLARELVAELFEEILPKQLVLQRPEHAGLDLVATNRQPVRARSLVACAEAHQAVGRAHDESRPAFAALRQAGEQISGSPQLAEVP